MTNEKNMTVGSPYAPWDLRRLPSFDFSEFLRKVEKPDGKGQTAELTLEGTKRWFRLACPSGGLVLNALRVTDTMAIFEARVFADANDRNPLASFTATKKADKAAGDAYIRAAQDAALGEALRISGFSLEVSVLARNMGLPEAAEGEAEASPAPAQDDVPRQKAEPPMAKADTPPKPVVDNASHPAPSGPQPSAPEETSPAPVTSPPKATPAPEARDAAPVVDINTRQPVTAGDGQPAVETPPAPDTAPAQRPPAEPAPAAYTADMTVDEITARMTLEQAQAVIVKDGTCKGWTLGQVAKDRPTSLRWFTTVCPFADNVLKGAATIVLNDLELKKAG